MKPKQLANVLTRILGLSLCAHSIPTLLGTAVTLFYYLSRPTYDGNPPMVNHYPSVNYSLNFSLSSIIEVAIGVYLIVRSRQVVEKLFKDEAE